MMRWQSSFIARDRYKAAGLEPKNIEDKEPVSQIDRTCLDNIIVSTRFCHYHF